MRSLWLASAASLFIAGAACAQTSQTGPAPTGAPNAAPMTNPGQSPGNTAPMTSGSATMAPPDAMSAPTKNASGAPNGPMVTPPGTSPGKTEASGSGMSSTMSTSGMSDKSAFENKPMGHHYGRGMGMGSVGMPNDASATTYLKIAKHSIMRHNKPMAAEALNRAETDMLNRSVPQGGIAADTSPGVTSIETARKALMAGDMKGAMAATDMAMQQSGGMSGDSGMSGGGMGSTSTMSSPMMASPPAKPMPHSIYGASNSGMAPAASDTSDSGAPSSSTATMSPSKPASAP